LRAVLRENLKNGRILVAVAVFSVAVAFFRLGATPLTDVDEAVFSEASREMIETGDWISPTYNYKPRNDKPILFYWLQGSAFLAFGVNEFAARLPSATAFTVLTLLLFVGVKHVAGPRAALWAALSWLLSLEPLVYGRTAVTDMVLTLFITVSCGALFFHVTRPRRRTWLRLAYGAAGCAVLTKGLVGIVIPAGVILIWRLLERRFRLRDVWDPAGVLLFLAVAAPWYVVQTLRDGGSFVNEFFIKHHFQRYTGVVSGHTGRWYFYIIVLCVGFFPWIAMIPWALGGTGKGEVRSLGRLAAIWLGFVALFFSASGTKLPNYLLPGFPAAAILAGLGMDRVLGDPPRRGVRLLGWVLFVSALGLAGGIWYVRVPLGNAALPVYAFIALGAVVVLTAYWGFYAGLRGRLGSPFYTAAIGVSLYLLMLAVLPVVTSAFQGTLRSFAREARSEHAAADGTLLAYKLNKPSLAFYYQGKVPKLRHLVLVKEYLEGSDEPAFIVGRTTQEVEQDLVHVGFRIRRREWDYTLFERSEPEKQSKHGGFTNDD